MTGARPGQGPGPGARVPPVTVPVTVPLALAGGLGPWLCHGIAATDSDPCCHSHYWPGAAGIAHAAAPAQSRRWSRNDHDGPGGAGGRPGRASESVSSPAAAQGPTVRRAQTLPALAPLDLSVDNDSLH